MSIYNIGFYEDLTKIIFELSSNTHLISSAAKVCVLSKNKKNITIFHLKIVTFTIIKIRSTLHGHVFIFRYSTCVI